MKLLRIKLCFEVLLLCALLSTSQAAIPEGASETADSATKVVPGNKPTPCLDALRRGDDLVRDEDGRMWIGSNLNCSDLCSGTNGAFAEGNFMHPGNCTQFIKCTDWRAEPLICPDSGFFDTTIQACSSADPDDGHRLDECDRRRLEPLRGPTRVAIAASGLLPTKKKSRTKINPTTMTSAATTELTSEVTVESTTALTTDASTEPPTEQKIRTKTTESEAAGINVASTTTTAEQSTTSTASLAEPEAVVSSTAVATEKASSKAERKSPPSMSPMMAASPFENKAGPALRPPAAVIRGRFYLPGTLYRIAGGRRQA
ncbi:hypothetical protein BV898_01739 [Hypsibius exemplaris]|uniref:Chitin-binding type-2 domain-containing protein n=1 Tax=Hypsibius exemplaris TaxID=2072580 RepID=A0A1W0XB72_HYPEX|nr:hypothetical protein BV898_01739 [Hypsibius exemplaris]